MSMIMSIFCRSKKNVPENLNFFLYVCLGLDVAFTYSVRVINRCARLHCRESFQLILRNKYDVDG